MTGRCFVDGCESPRGAKLARFCHRHQNMLTREKVRVVDLLPKCAVCGTEMREPAVACGLCLMEHRGAP